jgi:hypothetical protein
MHVTTPVVRQPWFVERRERDGGLLEGRRPPVVAYFCSPGT